MNTLWAFRGRHEWSAADGQPGSGSNCTGRMGQDLIIHVPPGTLVYDRDTGLLLKDLTDPGQRVILMRGGKGGLGNARFASPTHQAPRKAFPGQTGQERQLRLELKLIADVGLVGMPNAGKSTLLARSTAARPKIADYPFTTLVPQLGIVVLSGFRQYVMADLPGLIEGAHEGVGLGDAFLKHIERTRVIVHLIDICPSDGQPSPEEAYRIIRTELEKYSPTLAAKPELVVATKMDLTDSDENLRQFQEQLGTQICALSAVTGRGLDVFHEQVWRMIEEAKSQGATTSPSDFLTRPIDLDAPTSEDV